MLALEIGLRAAGFSEPVWYKPDPVLGWGLRPGLRGWYTDEGGRSLVVVNPAGYRDRSHERPKPANAYRVAVLGGATAEAMALPYDATFWWKLEGRLQKCPAMAKREVEVMNFGVSGYGPAQDAAVLERVAAAYRPDVVLLAFSPAEDLRPAPPSFGPPLRKWEPYAWWLADRLRAAQLAYLPYRRMPPASADPAALAAPRGAAWRRAWDEAERRLRQMNAFSRSQSARFAVILAGDPAPGDASYAGQRLAALAEREGFQAIFPARPRPLEAQPVYFGLRSARPGSARWNEKDHAAAAESLSRTLCAAFASSVIR